jgi:hypothetical protein
MHGSSLRGQNGALCIKMMLGDQYDCIGLGLIALLVSMVVGTVVDPQHVVHCIPVKGSMGWPGLLQLCCYGFGCKGSGYTSILVDGYILDCSGLLKLCDTALDVRRVVMRSSQ